MGSIFEKWPDRLSLKTESGLHRLKLETEDGVLQLVAAIRSPWEAARNAALEEATKFHLSGSSQVVVMQTLLTDDSVTPSTFRWEKNCLILLMEINRNVPFSQMP